MFSEFSELSYKNIFHYNKKEIRMLPQHQQHMWGTGSLNWAQFMLQWFIRFPDFAEFIEFNERAASFRKTPLTQM